MREYLLQHARSFRVRNLGGMVCWLGQLSIAHLLERDKAGPAAFETP